MLVRELIDLLGDVDPEAEVLLVSQPSWPFENSLRGVVERSAVLEVDEDEGDSPKVGDGCAPNDVLLVEGKQLRYGSKNCWEV